MQMLKVKDLSKQAMLGFDHVANRELRKFHERLRSAVGWRGGDAIADRVDQNYEVSAGVDHFSGTDELQQVFGPAAEPRWPENGVGFIGVELAQRAVANAKIMNHVAILQFQIAEHGELLRHIRGLWWLGLAASDLAP